MSNGIGSIEYIVVKALEDGVNVLTIHNNDGSSAINERLDEGEVFLLILNENHLGIRIRGQVEVRTKHGEVSGSSKILFHNP